jgi:hypothetical protein
MIQATPILTLIATARVLYARDRAADATRMVHQVIVELLNQWHMAQLRRGDLVHDGRGCFQPRPTQQSERLRAILGNHELFHDEEGRPLARNQAPPNWEELLAELDAMIAGTWPGNVSIGVKSVT